MIKRIFAFALAGAADLPSQQEAMPVGSYAKGCAAGLVALLVGAALILWMTPSRQTSSAQDGPRPLAPLISRGYTDAPGVTLPGSGSGCTATVEALGAELGETRGSTTTPFDNVNDYNSLATGVPASIDGTSISGLSSYSVSVAVVAESLSTVAAPASLRVTVSSGEMMRVIRGIAGCG